MLTTISQNKKIVQRFNREVIELGNMQAFHEMVSTTCINHSAPPGTLNGPETMIYFLFHLLRPAFTEINVLIHDQVAEDDRVTTRKSLHAIHTGEFMGIPASNKKVIIEVIDIIRIKNEQYVEHWGISNLQSLIAELSGK
jgi:predicted ester cyclase